VRRARVGISLGLCTTLAFGASAIFVGCAGTTREQTEISGLAPYRVTGRRYVPLRDWEGYREEGIASWYGRRHHGRTTASGERFDAYAGLTAAHKTLPFNVCAAVENARTGKRVVVRINDRGPFAGDRVIDLSRAAAAEIGLVRAGVAPVRVEAVGVADPKGRC
jgi:rare lipoprotein A